MKNPLYKRLKRELKEEKGRYIAISLFLVLFIGIMSGFLACNKSVDKIYRNSWDEYNVEDGHITFDAALPDELKQNLAAKNDVTFYDLCYKEEPTTIGENSRTIRVYLKRESVNLECVMEGTMPASANEIAIDRCFADNNSLKVGDTIQLDSKTFTISGTVALVDYSCLYESNSDMMFDAVNFGVAIMSAEGYSSISDTHLIYNYAWKYNTPYADDTEANSRSEAFIDSLEDIIIDYDEKAVQAKVDSMYGELKINVSELKDEFAAAEEEIEAKISSAAATAISNNMTEDELFDYICEKSGMSKQEFELSLINSLDLTIIQKAQLLIDSLTKSDEELMSEFYEMSGLDEEGLMEKIVEVSGISMEDMSEELLEKAAAKSGTTVNGMIAAELGISEETLNSLSDLSDDSEISDFSIPDEAPTIDLRSEDEDDSLDFDEEQIYSILDEIDNAKLYDTTSLRQSVSELVAMINSIKDPDEGIISVKNYIPRYLNQAINYVGTDGSSDMAGAELMIYMMAVILAFVFAITISGSITKEAGVIGTLRASGYTRGEIVRHYLVLPVLITFASAVMGNILGYTVFLNLFRGVYYSNYSLPTFKASFSAEALIKTTIVPVVLMFVINLLTLTIKMRISPLNFLRGELKKKGHRKAVKLSPKISFISRFRLRILLKNIPSYIVLFVGILFGGTLMTFSMMFGPLIDDYTELVTGNQICEYQYVLNDEEETATAGAEKFAATSLDTTVKGYVTDSVMVYGVQEGSQYIKASIPSGKVICSSAMMKKFGYKSGDEVTLKETYSNNTYTFTIADEYTYDGALAIFMNQSDYEEKFGEDEGYFNGYFSNSEITDIGEEYIATTITRQDMLKVVDQMSVSMLAFMTYFMYFGIAIFMLMMFLVTKQVLEKSSYSIALTKILGFSNREIAKLYLLITSFVVLGSLLISCPIIWVLLKIMFSSFMYTQMAGYIPYIVSNWVYVKMVLIGMASYGVIAALMFRKINKIPKSAAIKNDI